MGLQALVASAQAAPLRGARSPGRPQFVTAPARAAPRAGRPAPQVTAARPPLLRTVTARNPRPPAAAARIEQGDTSRGLSRPTVRPVHQPATRPSGKAAKPQRR